MSPSKTPSLKTSTDLHASGYLQAATILTAAAAMVAPLQAEDAPSRVHALLKVDFADQYVTPRGMLVHNQGLTVQPLFLTFVNVYKSESFLNDVTLVGGAWNDFSSSGVSKHAPYGSQPKTPWVEIDPIAGLSLGLGKNFKLDITYTAFAMQILDIGSSQHLETKLSFDDTPYLGAWALHPYILLWQELEKKATAAALPGGIIGLPPVNPSANHPAPGSSYYFDLGVAPGYAFKNFHGLKIEAPTRVLLPDERFYGDFYAKSSFVGLVETGLKASIPLPFMPAGYGHWSAHAGFKYLNFVDDNLYNLNAFNAPGKPTRDTVQVFMGISAFF